MKPSAGRVLASSLVQALNERGFWDDSTGRRVSAKTPILALNSDENKEDPDKALIEIVDTMLPAPLFSVLYDNEMKQYGNYVSFTEILIIDPVRKQIADKIELSALEGTAPEEWEWTIKDAAEQISLFLKEWKKKNIQVRKRQHRSSKQQWAS